MAEATATNGSSQSLEHTPTWAVAVVCFIIISISILLEHLIHLLTNWLTKHRKKALIDAVERLRSELMLLGFLSLFLAAAQKPISNICIPAHLADVMLPCKKANSENEGYKQQLAHYTLAADSSTIYHPLNQQVLSIKQRNLAEDEGSTTTTNSNSTTDPCTSSGKVSLVTQEGIQQLQMFIFVLAAMQIVYSLLTMALGRAKMRRWKAWEKETQTTEYQVANDPNRFRFTRQTTFGRRHMTNCTVSPIQVWIKSFFRQFFNSVAKVDYLTLRHGFISAHLSTRNSNFNFQKYIERSLDEDFKVVVSVSPVMWFIVVIFMLVDVHGWNVYLWVSYVPLLLVLVIGTKLEVIVARMALQIENKNSVVIGTPLVQPNDDLFWFGHPKFVLTLLHYTLFVNAFELAFFIWVVVEFGLDSCYHEHTAVLITRVVLAVTVQVLCSYITLPLYALVTQMGSHFKSKALEEQTANIIRQWHLEVRERRKKQLEEQSLQPPRASISSCSTDPDRWNSSKLNPLGFDDSSQGRPSASPTKNESTYVYSSGKGEINEANEDDVENVIRETDDLSSFRYGIRQE